MKSTTIKQLISNYIHQKNSNKEITIKKLPTQTNQKIRKMNNKNEKDFKNSSIKNQRKPRCFDTNRNYFDPNKKKLKSCSRYKNTHINKNKFKILVKVTKPNMNRTICNDGHGNIISNIHDRNLSAPSLYYDTNHQIYYNKIKKNNIIKLSKANKKLIDENINNRDSYRNNYMKLNINLNKNNNKDSSEEIDNKIVSITCNNNDQITETILDTKIEKNDENGATIKLKTIDNENNNNINFHKNDLNQKNFYKNSSNKKHKEIDNSNIDLSTFIKDIETIKNTRESIALLKEKLKLQDTKYKIGNNFKLNKTINYLNSTNSNQTNYNTMNNNHKIKKNNQISLINKSGYEISNFHHYNKNALIKKNKNNNNINYKINNNTCINDVNNISKDLTPNKRDSNTTRGVINNNINLSNSSNNNNNKTITISTNITNNNNFGKKINLTNIYGGQIDKEENNSKENLITKEDETNEINNKNNIDNNEEINNLNQFNTERIQEVNNNVNYLNDEAFSNRSNNINDNGNNKNQNNYLYLHKPNKNNNFLNKAGINGINLGIKNKKINHNNKNKEKNNINLQIQKQSKIFNKKKYASKNNYKENRNNELNPLSSRFNTLSNEKNINFNIKKSKSKNRVKNRDKSFEIAFNNKTGVSKVRVKNIVKSKEKYKNNDNINLKKKNSYKPFNNKNKPIENDKVSDDNLNNSSNKEKNDLNLSTIKYKSIYKIGIICEAGEASFGEKKTNQDNYFNSLINDDIRFIGVCDGHGEYGEYVSNYLRNNLPKQLEKSIKKFFKKEENNKNLLENEMSGNYNKLIKLEEKNEIFEKVQKVFEKSFSKTDKNLSLYCKKSNFKKKEKPLDAQEEDENNNFDVEYSGSTCVSVLLKDKEINKIYIANVGDSRAIIVKESQNETEDWIPYQLSRDHKPTEEDEAKRVIEYDGEIEKIEDDDGNWTGPLRVWVKGSDGPGLAMTRSFGDEVGASVGVVSVPEVTEYKIKEEDKAIIIASDGLWEYITNEEVSNIVKKLFSLNDPNIIVNDLFKESVIKWRLKDQGIDDITIICILLKSN